MQEKCLTEGNKKILVSDPYGIYSVLNFLNSWALWVWQLTGVLRAVATMSIYAFAALMGRIPCCELACALTLICTRCNESKEKASGGLKSSKKTSALKKKYKSWRGGKSDSNSTQTQNKPLHALMFYLPIQILLNR